MTGSGDSVATQRAIIAIRVLAALAGVGLIFLIVTSAHGYVFDEKYYMQGAELLVAGRSFHAFLLTPLNTPAGPLYAVLHWSLAPLTGLHAPAIRWVNFALLAALVLALAQTMRLWALDHPVERALMFLAIPTAWVTSGMALTEIPAVTAIAFSVLSSAWAMTAPPSAKVRIWSGFALAGVLFGVGVLGRQPFLPAVIGFVLVAIFSVRLRWAAALALLLALAVPAPVFLLWGGLVPPAVAFVAGAIKPEYGALGLAYSGVFVLILAPNYLVTRWKTILPVSIVAAITVTLAGGLSIEVAAGVARHLPPMLARVFQFGVTVVLVASGVAFILASGVNAWQRRDDRIFVLLVLLSVGLALTPAMVSHQFSSRYLMMTFPFLLLAVQPFFRTNGWAAGRLAAAAIFGFFSLQAFLSYSPAPY